MRMSFNSAALSPHNTDNKAVKDINIDKTEANHDNNEVTSSAFLGRNSG